MGGRFNWAIDWFDDIARGNPRTALRIVGDDGADESYSFDEMADALRPARRRGSRERGVGQGTA